LKRLFLTIVLLGIMLVSASLQSVNAQSRDLPVTISQTATSVLLSNGVISFQIEKSTGHVVNLERFGHRDILDASQRLVMYFDANGHGSKMPRRGYWGMGGAQCRIVRQSPDLVEVACTEAATAEFPFTTAVHYVIRRGEPCYYTFVTLRHAAQSPAGVIGQCRYVIKVRPSMFTSYFVTRREQGTYTPVPDNDLKEVTNATYQFPDGSVRTKYNNSAYENNLHVYGVTGSRQGLWMITPSAESINGGPTKQDLTVHQDATIVLRMLQSGHFLDGSLTSIRAVGSWSKIYGPYCVYLNSGASPQVMWHDARREARAQVRQWPYAWMQDSLCVKTRGSVTGILRHSNGELAAFAHVVLAAPNPDWQVQCMGYMFSATTTQQGRYTFRNVIPGDYSLYAFQDGYASQFELKNVRVSANTTKRMVPAVWPALAQCTRIWQIGVPDRSAGEFRHGRDRRQFGLWNLYPVDFPHDIDFVIGKSRPNKDWNYCQVVAQRPDGSWHRPVWKITFTLGRRFTGTALLALGIAGASQAHGLNVALNGRPLALVPLPHTDPCIYRDAVTGGMYRLKLVRFNGLFLRRGRNTISLSLALRRMPATPYKPLAMPRGGVMYDFVRLMSLPGKWHGSAQVETLR
jgi:rhamnogalacturonan endolyase